MEHSTVGKKCSLLLWLQLPARVEKSHCLNSLKLQGKAAKDSHKGSGRLWWSLYCFFFFNIYNFFFFFERQGESCLPLTGSLPQMPTVLELGVQCRSSTWVAETQPFASTCWFPRVYIRNRELKQTSHPGSPCSNGMWVTRPGRHPRNMTVLMCCLYVVCSWMLHIFVFFF